MKLETLTEAIGMIDDDLIANAKKPDTVQQKPAGSQAAAEPAAAPEASAAQVLSRSGAKGSFRRLRYAGWAAAAACLLLAAGVTLHLKRQKEDSSYTAASQSEQLVEVTVTSGTAQTTQPTETEHTTVTSPLTDASAADTAEDVTVTADAQTTATEAETPVTDPPANATAAPPAGTSRIPGTTKSTGTTSTASATQSSSQTTTKTNPPKTIPENAVPVRSQVRSSLQWDWQPEDKVREAMEAFGYDGCTDDFFYIFGLTEGSAPAYAYQLKEGASEDILSLYFNYWDGTMYPNLEIQAAEIDRSGVLHVTVGRYENNDYSYQRCFRSDLHVAHGSLPQITGLQVEDKVYTEHLSPEEFFDFPRKEAWAAFQADTPEQLYIALP